MNCLFCRIANREITSDIVFENERIIAFRDINSQAPIHILIIPKKHISNFDEISFQNNDLLGEIMNIIRELANKENISKTGYRVVVNCGPNAGQSIDHLHFHLLGGRKFNWPPG